MAIDDDPTRDLLARVQALGHIRLARGVVGKTSIVAGLVFIVLGAIAVRLPTELLFGFAALILGGFFLYLAAMLWFAHRHPEQALLEGAEIIQYREQEMAAKGVQSLPAEAATTPGPLRPSLPEE